jgi:hypothetical protein
MIRICGQERDSLSWGVGGTVQPANAAVKSLLSSTVQLKYQGPLKTPYRSQIKRVLSEALTTY